MCDRVVSKRVLCSRGVCVCLCDRVAPERVACSRVCV